MRKNLKGAGAGQCELDTGAGAMGEVLLECVGGVWVGGAALVCEEDSAA